MNPIRRAWEWLYPPATKLRNKPGGMAWIKGLQNVTGEHVLNSRAVKTVAVDQHGLWKIDPPQLYATTGTAYYAITDTVITAGGSATVLFVADKHLEPWKETGLSDTEVQELYEPSKKSTPQTAEIASSDRAVLSAVLLSARAKKRSA